MSGHGKHHSKHGFKRHELLSLLITFGVGMVAGGYLYLTGFAPQFEEYSGQTDAVYEDLVIVGESYGGMRRDSAPSFQLLNDGTFRYLAATPFDESQIVKEGSVPNSLLKAVKKELSQNSLTKAEQLNTNGPCVSAVDGTDYRYTITQNNVTYDLDSCGTEFTVESALGVSLNSLWSYFNTLR